MSRAMRWIAVALVAVGAVSTSGVLAQPGQPQQQPPAASTDIVVGEYASMTGALASFGIATSNGTALALDEWNGKGGVKKRRVTRVLLDTASKATEAAPAVERLIDANKAVAVLGEVTSSASLAGAAVAQRKGVPMITPASTHEDVTKTGDKISRVCVLDAAQARAIARFAAEKLARPTVAILQDDTQAYSKGLAAAFAADYTARGGTIAGSISYSPANPDFAPQVAAVRKTGARAVFIPGYVVEAAMIAKAFEKARVKVILLGTDGWDSSDLVKLGGSAVDGAYYTNHFTPTDPRREVKAFVAAYRARYKTDPDSLAALGYDAANVLLDAMERAPSLAGADIAKAIRATRDFPGVTGAITIDGSGNASKPVFVVRVVGGAPKHVATITP